METLRTIKTFLTILRALVVCVLLFLACSLAYSLVCEVLSAELTSGLLDSKIVSLYIALFFGVILFCYTRLFALYHTAFREECALCRKSAKGFGATLKGLFSCTPFVILFLTLCLLLTVLPNASGIFHLACFLFGPTLTYRQTYLTALFLLPIEAILVLLAHVSAVRSIRKETRREAEWRGQKANRHLIWESTKLTLNAVSAAILLPLVIFMASSLVILMVFFPTILAVILAFYVIRFLRAFRIRHRFINELKKLCQEKHHRLGKLSRPYLSLLWENEGENFTLTTGGKTYSCKLVYSVRRNVPMFFHRGGWGTFVKTISIFRMEVAHHVKAFRYGFESDNHKIIVVCPVPKKILARRDTALTEVDNATVESKFIYMGIGAKGTKSKLYEEKPIEGGISRELDVGEAFDGYRFYNASGFLNAIERGVLDHE